MEKVEEKLDKTTDFRAALKDLLVANNKAVKLEIEHRAAKAKIYVKKFNKNHYFCSHQAEIETEASALAAAMARNEATALGHLVMFLRTRNERPITERMLEEACANLSAFDIRSKHRRNESIWEDDDVLDVIDEFGSTAT